MDKPIKKKTWTAGRIIFLVVSVLAVASLVYLYASRSGKPRLKVDPSRMTFSRVGYGEFREYYPFDAKVEPVTSVYLDVETGGRVEQIFAEGGKFVKKGELILRFSNDSMQRSSIDTETRLLDTLDIQRNTQFTREQNALVQKENLLNLNYQIADLERKYRRYQALGENPAVISQEDLQSVRDELNYKKSQRDLLEERIRQEDRLGQIQLEQANQSIQRLNKSLDLLAKTVESLEVRAPIAGYLSSIEAEVGQNIGPGKRIGQIDLLDKLKLRAGIDQYYIAKVNLGTKGKFTLEGKTYEVAVEKIYPEVKEDKITVDLSFVGEMPQGIKRGQTLTVELDFSESGKSLVAPKGGFYNQTNGRWVYLLSEDRTSASRANIRTGRQNPRDVEVLEGLREGDWIITSGYDSFNEVDTLVFPQAVELGK
ncbi:MAG TPA: HlyD family efflux transporter periplasmic adaptor subunit [Acidobacteriota bacterium]|nr:HlyD family efflux transporter periplasmic adaptor subunit [Acidobacteriota bacterium]